MTLELTFGRLGVFALNRSFLNRLMGGFLVAWTWSQPVFCQGQNSFAFLGTAAFELPVPKEPNPFVLGTARDRWGKNILLFGRTNPGFIVTQVALSEVYAALGLEHVPVYPTFGTIHGASWEPTSAEELQSQWFVAAATPKFSDKQLPPQPGAEISWEAVEQRALLAWLDVAFMASGRREAWVEGTPLSTPPGQVKLFGVSKLPSNKDLHQQYLLGDKFPWRRLESASAAEVESLTRKTRTLLDRLDAVSTNHFDALLGPLLGFVTPKGASFELTSKIRNRAINSIRNLRSFVQWHLSVKIGRSFKQADVTQPGPLPRLMVPEAQFLGVSTDWPVLQDSAFVISHANALLYAYAMSPPWKQLLALDRWHRELGTKNPIHFLINVAAGHDGSTRWIAHAIPGPSREAEATPLQLTLSENAMNGVLAFSAADAEGQEILSAAQTIASRLNIIPMQVRTRNGSRLTRSDIETLFEIARTQKRSYVAICELGGIPAEISSEFAQRNRLWTPGGTSEDIFSVVQNDPALAVFDHHQTAQSSWRHSSSLELLADFTGLQMSINQIGTAILDRSGVPGLLELGLTKQEVTEYLIHRSTQNRLAALERRGELVYSGPDVLHWIVAPGARFPDVSKGMGLAAYPDTANFVLVNSGNLIVHSSPTHIHALRDLPTFAALDTVYGGDGRRSSYFIIPFKHQTLKPSSQDIETWGQKISDTAIASGLSCSRELLSW
jgi:hypothetical protein